MATITFEVKDMTCGHCVSSITKAVQAVDPGAAVQADLGAHRVRIESARASVADVDRLRGAIEDAGFTPASLP